MRSDSGTASETRFGKEFVSIAGCIWESLSNLNELLILEVVSGSI